MRRSDQGATEAIRLNERQSEDRADQSGERACGEGKKRERQKTPVRSGGKLRLILLVPVEDYRRGAAEK